jgi:probable addiction module antidote protein
MREYRTLGDVEEVYLRDHPEEIDAYIDTLFEEFSETGDTKALLSSLRIVGRVKGVSRIAEVSGITRKGIQKALSPEGNPAFTSINAIMHAMGYRLAPRKIDRRPTP